MQEGLWNNLRWRAALWNGVLLSAMLLLGGCAGAAKNPVRLDPEGGMRAAQLPAFLTGPIGVLLASTNDYSARLVQSGVTNSLTAPAFGYLFQQQGELLFVPHSDENNRPDPWAGSFRFLWDLKANSGFLVSEVLHGYRPMNAWARYHVLSRDPPPIAQKPEMIDGHSCTFEDVTVQSDTGAQAAFRVWRSEELGDLPLKISSTEPDGLSLTLTELNPDAVAPDLLAVPIDYVKFDTVEAMVHELTRRPRIMPYTSSQELRRRR